MAELTSQRNYLLRFFFVLLSICDSHNRGNRDSLLRKQCMIFVLFSGFSILHPDKRIRGVR